MAYKTQAIFTEINPEQQLIKEQFQFWKKFLDAKDLFAESLQSSAPKDP
jgi:hypothetical protein